MKQQANKIRVALLFGSCSSEHEVSCVSAAAWADALATMPDRYEVILVGITKQGRWLKYSGSTEGMRSGSWEQDASCVPCVLSPDRSDHGLLVHSANGYELLPVDVVAPILHGKNGEDGTIQGIFELAKIPYVGCGVLASSVSMDKVYTKQIVDHTGVRQAAYELVIRKELEKMDEVVARIENRFAYPVFIKPSNAGSSRGVSKASDREELIAGLKEAAHHDRKILVEETIVGREIECAVFGNGTEPVIASGVGEILAAADFYDFDAKYYNAESRTVVNPELPGDATERVRQAARRIFKAVDGYGLSRVDFFVTKDGEVIFNEINTMPGFTAISMYPMLFEAAGIPKPEMVTKLIEHGLKRYEA